MTSNTEKGEREVKTDQTWISNEEKEETAMDIEEPFQMEHEKTIRDISEGGAKKMRNVQTQILMTKRKAKTWGIP